LWGHHSLPKRTGPAGSESAGVLQMGCFDNVPCNNHPTLLVNALSPRQRDPGLAAQPGHYQAATDVGRQLGSPEGGVFQSESWTKPVPAPLEPANHRRHSKRALHRGLGKPDGSCHAPAPTAHPKGLPLIYAGRGCGQPARARDQQPARAGGKRKEAQGRAPSCPSPVSHGSIRTAPASPSATRKKGEPPAHPFPVAPGCAKKP